MFKLIVLSAFVACASAIVATPYGLAAPVSAPVYSAGYHGIAAPVAAPIYSAGYHAPLASSYANTYKVAGSYPYGSYPISAPLIKSVAPGYTYSHPIAPAAYTGYPTYASGYAAPISAPIVKSAYGYPYGSTYHGAAYHAPLATPVIASAGYATYHH